jgi:hypothetical protein
MNSAGGTTTATAAVNCGGTLDPANVGGAGACPVAQFYCEAVALDTTSSAQALDACNACLGASCALTTTADSTSGADAAAGTGSAGTDYYVYSNALSTADANCTVTPYTPVAGQVFSDNAGTCSSGNW